MLGGASSRVGVWTVLRSGDSSTFALGKLSIVVDVVTMKG